MSDKPYEKYNIRFRKYELCIRDLFRLVVYSF
ncbi:hypothetical protein T12_3708 [Trichinella patagoniensis]|uniref:Uncharacterized protein n=1 Tax=Trichinella patagoniensis TaxID=990121 RepID=A0A0V0YR04_9BILA|nr:hypothetical protein T12_3708 [Trichinella patagoniensis]